MTYLLSSCLEVGMVRKVLAWLNKPQNVLLLYHSNLAQWCSTYKLYAAPHTYHSTVSTLSTKRLGGYSQSLLPAFY